MKQKGQIWTDNEGNNVPVKYLPDYPKKAEQFASAIEEAADKIVKTLQDGRRSILDWCGQMREAHLKENTPTKVFTFFSFDRQVKIEFDYAQKYVRIYKSTVPVNPTLKDYKILVMEFNSIDIERPEPQTIITDAKTIQNISDDVQAGKITPEQAVKLLQEEPIHQDSEIQSAEPFIIPNSMAIPIRDKEHVTERFLTPEEIAVKVKEAADQKHITHIKNSMAAIRESDEVLNEMADAANDGPVDDTDEEQLNLNI